MSTALADKPATPAAQPLVPISWKAPIGYSVLAVLSLLVFGLFAPGGRTTGFTFATSADFFAIPRVDVATKPTALVLSLIALALAGVSWWLTSTRRRTGWWLPALFTVVVMRAMLAALSTTSVTSGFGVAAAMICLAVAFTGDGSSGLNYQWWWLLGLFSLANAAGAASSTLEVET